MTSARAPLTAYAYRALRCPACKALGSECFCRHLGQVHAPLPVILVQHAKERWSQSSTGQLVAHVLPGCEILHFGSKETPFRVERILSSTLDPIVLYPGLNSPVLSPADLVAAPGRQTALVVLDATWRQARRMLVRTPGLSGLRIHRLPAGATPRWRLRQPPQPGQLNTAEAVAQALEILGFSVAATAIRAALEVVARQVLRLRGVAAPS